MAQQVQFVYLTQSEYDALATKDQGRLYFTSDTKRVYKGDEPYTQLLTTRGDPSTPGFSAWETDQTGEFMGEPWDYPTPSYGGDGIWYMEQPMSIPAECSGGEDATSLTFYDDDCGGGDITFARTALPGYQLGTQSDKPLATAEQGAKADTAIQGIKVNGTTKTPDDSKVVDVSVPRVFYGTCSTSAGTAAKVVICTQFTSSDFVAGTKLIVKFSAINTSTTPSITVGGATKRIYRYGTINPATYMWYAGQMVEFVYDGTYWLMVNPGPATTIYEGVVKLNDSLTSTSTTQAATANAVKQLNDKFDAALSEKRDYDDLSYTAELTDYPKNTFVVSNANMEDIDGEYTYTTQEQAQVPGDGWYKDATASMLWFLLDGSTITAVGPSYVQLDTSLAEQDVSMPIGDPSSPSGYLTFHLLRRVPNDSLALDSEKADISHAHGNITSDGALQTTSDITIANGDKLVVTDASGSNKVARASLTFDGQNTTQYLSKKGTWQSFPTASTSASGVVQLNDTLTSTSTTEAATANSVKTLNDNILTATQLSEGTGLTKWVVTRHDAGSGQDYRVIWDDDPESSWYENWVIQYGEYIESEEGEGHWEWSPIYPVTSGTNTDDPNATYINYSYYRYPNTYISEAYRSNDGYVLGSQTDKVLAKQENVIALDKLKQDKLSNEQIANINTIPDKANQTDIELNENYTWTTNIPDYEGDPIIIRWVDEDQQQTGWAPFANEIQIGMAKGTESDTSLSWEGEEEWAGTDDLTAQKSSEAHGYRLGPNSSSNLNQNKILASYDDVSALNNTVEQLNDKFDDYVSIADLEEGLEVDDIEARSITIDGANVATQAWVTQQIQSAITNALQTQY